jgi:putative glutathione S-transferase
MGLLVDGQWHDVWYDTASHGGRFIRKDAAFRNWVTADGAPGPTGEGGFRAEPGRYHLYVSLACPWAHRTLILRALKGLEAMVSVSVVNWLMLENGWTFDPAPGVVPDAVYHARFMHQIYTAADPAYTGRVTVPVLWDKARGTIVSNESSEIIRMFNAAFDRVGRCRATIIPRRCARGSMRSTRGSMTRSTTAFTRPVSPRHRPPMRKPSLRSSPRLTGWKICWARGAISPATA